MRTTRFRSSWHMHVLFALIVGVLPGCGAGSGVSSPGVTTSKTGTFYSDVNNVLVGTSTLVGVGRGFVTLNQGVPTAVGLELGADAVRQLPPSTTLDLPTVYGVNLPPESVYTPFSYIAIAYFGAGHSPRGTGDIPHFHPVFGMGPPQLPDPPNFTSERTPVATAEIPEAHADIADMAAGIGEAFQDSAQPQAQPGWDSTGQNYFFYNGHMNAIALGATNAFLLRQQAGTEPARGDVIKQPQVYPRPGFYPNHYTVRYDPGKKVYVFVLEDFRRAVNVLPQRLLLQGIQSAKAQ